MHWISSILCAHVLRVEEGGVEKGWWRREVNREKGGWRKMKENEMRRECGVREVKGVWSEGGDGNCSDSNE